MKHPLDTTLLLLMAFLLTQVFGLFILNQSISEVYTTPEGIKIVEYSDTVIGPRPEMAGLESFIYILAGVAMGTCLMLIVIKFGIVKIWSFFYFFAVWMSCSLSLGVLIEPVFAILIAMALAVFKTRGISSLMHNATEVLMYAGIVLIFAPILDVMWAGLLLVVISVYDVFAVMKTGHMVAMAKFQTGRNMFAGLMIPYGKGKSGHKPERHATGIKTEKIKVTNAILGGGDITFPLIFSGTVMHHLIISAGMTKSEAFLSALAIPLCVFIALSVLLFRAKKDKFYPAMPVVTAGCMAGLGMTIGIAALL